MSIERAPGATGPGRDFALGAYHMLPLLVGVIPFGLLLGALGAEKGFGPFEMALMSATVFAGASQFVAVGLWDEPLPILTIVLTTALVNIRHVLMSAAIGPRLHGFGTGRSVASLFLLCDEVWAMAMQAAAGGRLTPAYYAGLAIPFYLSWIFWSALGTVAGNVIQEPARYGFDFAFTALFLVLIRSLWRGRSSIAPVLASLAAALLAYRYLPGVWYIFAGGIAGTLAGAIFRRGEHGR